MAKRSTQVGTTYRQVSLFWQASAVWESCPLFSGSSGNAIYIGGGHTKILVDAGMPASALGAQLLDLDIDPATIDGILVTHEHSDHIKGLGAFARKHQTPIYVTPKTWQAMRGCLGNTEKLKPQFIEANQVFYLGDLAIFPFQTSHDAADPVGFRIATDRGKVAVCTDLGKLTAGVKEALAGVDTIYLEANYDDHLLFSGRYPYLLKKRISGEKGHLSNTDAGLLGAELVKSGCRKLILSHLSQENNFPELAELTVAQALRQAGIQVDTDVTLETAPRHSRGRRQTLL